VGSYGFEACVLPLGSHERSILDSAFTLLARTRVALVVEPGALSGAPTPEGFTVIVAADWQTQPFPTDWIDKAQTNNPIPAVFENNVETTHAILESAIPVEQFGSARRRLKSLAARAQRDLGEAGFGKDLRLDSMAMLEDEISWASASASGFGLVLVIVRAKTASATLSTERSLDLLRESVGCVVRSSDAIAQGSDSLLVIVPEADEKQTGLVASRIANRIRRALKSSKSDKVLIRACRHATLGIATYPVHGLTREMLLARATASGKRVRPTRE